MHKRRKPELGGMSETWELPSATTAAAAGAPADSPVVVAPTTPGGINDGNIRAAAAAAATLPPPIGHHHHQQQQGTKRIKDEEESSPSSMFLLGSTITASNDDGDKMMMMTMDNSFDDDDVKKKSSTMDAIGGVGGGFRRPPAAFRGPATTTAMGLGRAVAPSLGFLSSSSSPFSDDDMLLPDEVASSYHNEAAAPAQSPHHHHYQQSPPYHQQQPDFHRHAMPPPPNRAVRGAATAPSPPYHYSQLAPREHQQQPHYDDSSLGGGGGTGLPPGLPPGLPTGFRAAPPPDAFHIDRQGEHHPQQQHQQQHYHQQQQHYRSAPAATVTTTRPFSLVIGPPPIQPIQGAPLSWSSYTDDASTITTVQPSLAASSVSTASLSSPHAPPPVVAACAPGIIFTPQSGQMPSPTTTATKPPKAPPSNPKSDLHTYYGKQKSGKGLAATNYHTWHDGGPAHQLRWTSVLCCPNHGVLYYSIPYRGCSDGPPHYAHGSYWFAKKITAEHAAAAHAYDYQTGTNALAAIDPLPAPQWDVPSSAAPALKATIELQQNTFRIANGQQPLMRL